MRRNVLKKEVTNNNKKLEEVLTLHRLSKKNKIRLELHFKGGFKDNNQNGDRSPILKEPSGERESLEVESRFNLFAACFEDLMDRLVGSLKCQMD